MEEISPKYSLANRHLQKRAGCHWGDSPTARNWSHSSTAEEKYRQLEQKLRGSKRECQQDKYQ